MTRTTIRTEDIADTEVTNAKVADDAIGVDELSATGTASASTFLRGDNAWAAAGGDNTPRFQAFLSVNQDPTNSTWTKVQFNGELDDSDGAYDTSNYRFTVPSGEGGTYFFYSNCTGGSQGTGAVSYYMLSFYKNGSIFTNGPRGQWYSYIGYLTAKSIQTMMILVPDDYVEVFGYVTESGTNCRFTADYCSFGGFKLL